MKLHSTFMGTGCSSIEYHGIALIWQQNRTRTSQHRPQDCGKRENAMGTRKTQKSSTSSQMLFGAARQSKSNIFLGNGSICPERMKLLQKSSRETHFEATATCFEYSRESQGFRRGTPGKPDRDRRKSLGTPRNRAWVAESILSKDVHESTWGAFLSSRWTF